MIGAIFLSLSLSSAATEPLRYRLVPRTVVEARLGEYRGTDSEREATLKRMFVEAGCSKHLSEQPVPRSKAPNLICVHPGKSGRVIIVGAHFDRVLVGDGVADNWSGASLLPSLYQAVKTEPRRLVLALGYVGKLLELPLNAVNFERVGTTDSESFAKRKIPRITVHSLTQENYRARILHSARDKLSVINLDDYYDTYQLLAGYLVFLDHYLDQRS